MKTKTKKGLAWLISLCMIVMLFPVSAMAATPYAISGTVDAGETGASVEGITVNLYAASDTEHEASLATATTDEAGAYSFDNKVEAGSYVAVVAASEGNYAESTADVTVTDTDVTDADITLVAETPVPVTYAISGKVDAGETEASVEGIPVDLYAASDTAHETSLATATTDEAGAYSFDNKVETGSYVVVVAASEGSYAESTADVTVSDTDVTDADITLAAETPVPVTYSVSGKVDAGETEASVEGITVDLYAADDTEHETSLATATTDETGAYSFTDKVAAGSYVVVVAASEGSYAESTVEVTVTDTDVTDADITLVAETPVPVTYAISGTVDAGETGASVEGITVDLYAASDTAHENSLATATTDETGAYTFDNKVEAGSYVAVVAASEGNYAESTANVTVSDTDVTDADITLVAETPVPVTYAISGTVDAGETGASVEGITVDLYAASDTAHENSLATATTDETGAYTFDNKVEAGSYVAVVAASEGNYAESTANVTVSDTDLTDADITLVAETPVPVTYAISGTVDAGETGASVEGITIDLYAADDTAHENSLATATTDETGAYSFTDKVAAGSYVAVVAASEGNYAESTADVTVTDTDVTDADITLVAETPVPVTYAISGTVDAGETGASVEGITIDLYAADDTAHENSLATATTDETGAYSFTDKVAAGSYVAVVAASEGNYAESTADVTVTDTDVTDADITLVEADYTLSIGGETDGGVGRSREITIGGMQSGDLTDKYLVVAITEGVGDSANVTVVEYALTDTTANISYNEAGAAVEAWIVGASGMPLFTDGTINAEFVAHTTTAIAE